MMQPNFEQLIQLAIDGETSMWGNETLHTLDNDKDYKYWYNYEGTYWYHFTSLEHLIKFFLGTTQQQDEAKELCWIQEYDGDRREADRERGDELEEDDYYNTIHNGMLMKQLVLMENKEFYFNPTTGDTYRVDGDSLLWDEPVHVNDIEIDEWFDLLNENDKKLIDTYYTEATGYTLDTIMGIRSWGFDDRFTIIPRNKVVIDYFSNDKEVYGLDLNDGSEKLIEDLPDLLNLVDEGGWAFGEE